MRWKCLQITSGFAKLGGGVTTQTFVHPLTAGDNPNRVRLSPQLRKAAGPLDAIGRAIAGKGKSNQTRSDFGFPGLQRDLLKNRVFHMLIACKAWSKLVKKNEKSKFFQDKVQNADSTYKCNFFD